MTAEAASTLDDAKTVRNEFREAVNMDADALTKWLDTAESREVGFKDVDGAESVGHQSGRRIVLLLGKRARDLDDGDVTHMRKVVGYVHRHLAQRPGGDIERSRWRYSLMNWGHDPLKE